MWYLYQKEGRERVGIDKIAFTNTAIDNLKYKAELDKGKFIKIRFKDQRGIHLYWSPRTSVKKFHLRIKFNHKDIDLDLGAYLKGTYGCDEVLLNLSEIYKKHRKNGKWQTNPKEEQISTDELIESQKLTVRKVIEKLCEYNFPRKDIEGRLASITAYQFSLFLIGHNKRRDHLTFNDDKEGMCTIGFKTDRLNRKKKIVFDSKGIKSWKELWSKYPSGRGIKKGKEISGAREISGR